MGSALIWPILKLGAGGEQPLAAQESYWRVPKVDGTFSRTFTVDSTLRRINEADSTFARKDPE